LRGVRLTLVTDAIPIYWGNFDSLRLYDSDEFDKMVAACDAAVPSPMTNRLIAWGSIRRYRMRE
jgi:hypothetical protein